MIVDTSALVAIVMREEGADELLATLTSSDAPVGIGTPTIVELGVVLSARLGRDARTVVVDLLDQLDIAEIPFDAPHWREAVGAFWRFGRGRHPAALNLGDCLTYAVARVADEPLLYVGADFAATDLVAA